MEHTPPPFFKTGPSALTRLISFSLLSVVLLVSDAHYAYLETLRQVSNVMLSPLERLVHAPSVMWDAMSTWLTTVDSLRQSNAVLLQENRLSRAQNQKTMALELENRQLRSLLMLRQKVSQNLVTAEILYAMRDPFSRRVILDQGREQNMQAGAAVMDALGVVGQITRIYSDLSEVTLITDKGQLVPVLNARNGLRSIVAGTGVGNVLELQFVPLNADVQKGDALVTSGIDGIYPAGLPVAEVLAVLQNPAQLFMTVICRPLAGVDHYGQVYVVEPNPVPLPARPTEAKKPALSRAHNLPGKVR